MATTKTLPPSSGIMLCTSAIADTLTLPLATVTGLALDGQEVLTLDLLKTGQKHLCAYEAVLRSLGYRLDLVAQTPPPDLRKLTYDVAGYQLVMSSLPRAIPLTEVSPEQVRKRFVALAMQRSHRYDDLKNMSLDRLSERIVAMVTSRPKRVSASMVPQALDVIPLLMEAHHGIAGYHLPLLSGYPPKAMNHFVDGGVDRAIDRHVTFLAHLGMHLCISGPAGAITVTPTLHSLASCVRAAETFRLHRSALAQQAPPKKNRKSRKGRAARVESSLSIKQILRRLAAGKSPKDIAKAAKVSHQRIYFIAKQAGLGVRQRKAKISSQVIALMPPPPPK